MKDSGVYFRGEEKELTIPRGRWRTVADSIPGHS